MAALASYRIHGVLECRARAIEDALRERPWLSAGDLALVFGINPWGLYSPLLRLYEAGYLIRRVVPGGRGRAVSQFALPDTPADARTQKETVKAEPVRRADGVLVCPTVYAFGYAPACPYVRSSGRKGARQP